MRFFITVFIVILSFLSFKESIAQGGLSAVMTVQVEVMASSHIESNLDSDITNQIVEFRENKSSQNINIGEFTLRVPEGIEYSTHIDQRIEMTGGSSEWSMNSTMHFRESDDGAVSYYIEASSVPDYISTGFWQGEQVATIEYH